MARLMSRLFASPRANRRIRIFSRIAFGLVAVANIWIIAEEGVSPARVVAAIVGLAVVVVDMFVPKRGRLLRRRTQEESP